MPEMDDSKLNNDDFILQELCLSDDKVLKYYVNADKKLVTRSNKTVLAALNPITVFKNLVHEIFLPRGYPNSVSEDYTWYQIWDTLQACCSTFCSMLAVQAVLEGVGVGRENATPLVAAIAWFTKDGVGMIAGIFFAWSKGCFLDSQCKKWRLFADVVNDFAFCLELSISAIVDRTVILLCISSAMKAVVGVAGGATRAALTHHQATRGNTADVAAKDGSQETVVNLAAMSLGVWLLNTNVVQRNAWIVMAILISFHLYCNFKAVKSLRLRKLNDERFLLLLDTYLATGKVLSVEDVNLKESVILGIGFTAKQLCGFSISLGDSLQRHNISAVDLETLLLSSHGSNYVLVPDKAKLHITIIMKPSITDKEMLKAYFHAVLHSHLLSKVTIKTVPKTPLRHLLDAKENLGSVSLASLSILNEEFQIFAALCAKEGWIFDEHVLHVEQWRVDWQTARKDV